MIDLDNIIGQDSAIERLLGDIASDRLPHAFLFAGPRGVGRRTTATALAALLLCQQPAADLTGRQRACGSCRSCKLFTETDQVDHPGQNHPDFHLVYKELAQFHDDANVRNRVMQDLSIGVIRQFLISPAGRSSGYGRGKVFVVLEADLMSNAAQNALLKTLEEPPPGVRIILISQRPDRLLPTTLSRCSLVRFAPLPADFVAGKLADSDIPTDEAAYWARLTGGSIGRSLELHELGLYEIKCDMIQRLADLSADDASLGEDMAKTADKLATAEVKQAAKDQGADLSKNLASRKTSGALLEILASAFSDAIIHRSGGGRELINTDQAQAVRTLAERFEADALADIVDQLNRYEALLWRNLNQKTLWDNVVITCRTAQLLQI